MVPKAATKKAYELSQDEIEKIEQMVPKVAVKQEYVPSQDEVAKHLVPKAAAPVKADGTPAQDESEKRVEPAVELPATERRAMEVLARHSARLGAAGPRLEHCVRRVLEKAQ